MKRFLVKGSNYRTQQMKRAEDKYHSLIESQEKGKFNKNVEIELLEYIIDEVDSFYVHKSNCGRTGKTLTIREAMRVKRI